ncbi:MULTISPECIES: DUF262 domain-containing protein [Gordonia]|uniref:DUF262 domain-containing protein n=2 Tax=Gordonia sihwensis TaxID=173559 RepID=L7LMS2_9ACTN|nr:MULTISPECIES: DUF262 domain-containing protein [Gordonia]AUH68593.1 DUF262 domain-containing protein [Gordonia sp. YC-JH1]MBY4571129.1 hypothetical protein [Gordonia sihwensis]WFN91661.1 DUF262 domain-containing HNH endonuclease family protein [Gordonia sihwensis]GAC62435.1 hypothetical protein GSI01S_34_00470 [Gordonia sihwensis NBRC 108236]
MKPETHTVQQLFERDVRYIVPLYQRPYVWTEDEQLAPLWDDVSALLAHQESGDASFPTHFLGAIVLDQEPTAPGKIPQYTVIDGQQRLTTMQLLIAATANAMSNAGADDDAALLRDLISNNERKSKGIERFKVWPTNANRDSFAAVMAPAGPTDDREDDPNNRIDEAYDYFVNRVAEYLAGADDDTPSEDGALFDRAERLRITLSDLLKVVSITLEPNDNAQVIFETLNARGTPLLALDLVKNAVFREASRQHRDTDDLYDNLWKPALEDDYWRAVRRQGRLNRPVGEHFLMHWLAMKLERVIPATELFATFRQSILQPGIDAEALLRELCKDAAVMRSFDDFQTGTVEGDFIARLEPLGAGTALPVVLLLFRTPEITLNVRRRALRILESFLARRALMRLTTQNYNRIVPRMIAAIKADPAHADTALLAVLAAGEGYATRWPGDGEFSTFLRTRDVYDYISRKRLIMAFSAVESSLDSRKTDVVAQVSDLSLEHLMPQQWDQHWPVDADTSSADHEAITTARDARVHRLGNLTIVAGSLNSAMSNAPWATKRAALNRHSRLLLNAWLAEQESWDTAAIDDRGQWLVDRLTDIWPGPDSATWHN